MSDKILSQHTVFIENRQNMKITGIVQVVAYDEFRVVIKTDYGRMTVSGRNLVAGQMNTENQYIT